VVVLKRAEDEKSVTGRAAEVMRGRSSALVERDVVMVDEARYDLALPIRMRETKRQWRH
jgi:hypothetical protein